MYIPPEVDLKHPEKYVLSLRISPTDFMFAFSDAGVNTQNYCVNKTSIETAVSPLEYTKKIFYDFNFFTLPYHRINVALVNDAYSIIPCKFFDVQKKEHLFFLTNKYKDNQSIFADEIELADSVVLNQADKYLYSFLMRNLYQPTILGHISLLCSFFLENARKVARSTMYINAHEDYIDIVCVKNGELKLAQTFHQLSKSDTIYFILKIWESLKWDQQTGFVYYFGKIEEAIIETLKNYIKIVEPFALPSEIFLWNKQIQNAPLDLIYLSI